VAAQVEAIQNAALLDELAASGGVVETARVGEKEEEYNVIGRAARTGPFSQAITAPIPLATPNNPKMTSAYGAS